MKYLYSTETHHVFEDFYEGNQVRFLKDRVTSEIRLHGEDVAKCLGFNSIDEMLLSNDMMLNAFLDGLNSGRITRI